MPARLEKRPALMSVLFILDECCKAIDALKEMNRYASEIRKMNLLERDTLPISNQTVIQSMGAIRDQLCIRLRNLFDHSRPKNTHSLKKYYQGELIGKLEKHPLTIASIKAANKNIAHMSDEFTQWPPIEDILNSELKDWLERIKLGILLNR